MPLLVTRAFQSKQSIALLYSHHEFSMAKPLFEVNGKLQKEGEDGL